MTAVDIVPEKVEKINKRISPIQDEYIEKYLKEKVNYKGQPLWGTNKMNKHVLKVL